MANVFKSIGKGKCAICNTSKKGPVMLIPIDGTVEDNVERCIVVHVDCLDLRISKRGLSAGESIIYQGVTIHEEE